MASAEPNRPSGTDPAGVNGGIGEQSLSGISEIAWERVIRPHRYPAGWDHGPCPLDGRVGDGLRWQQV